MGQVIPALAGMAVAFAGAFSVLVIHNEVAGRWQRHRAIKRRLREIRNGRVG